MDHEPQDTRRDDTLPPATAAGPRDAAADRQALWQAIRLHTEQIGFTHFAEFVRRAIDHPPPPVLGRTMELGELHHDCEPREFGGYIPGGDLYGLLKVAAEIFLLLRCGVCKWSPLSLTPDETGRTSSNIFELLEGRPAPNADDLVERLTRFLGSDRGSYIVGIIQNVYGGADFRLSPFSPIAVGRGPCLLELIWSYWHEEGMLVQTTQALALRFQNVARNGRDPLVEFELSPLRPLSGFIWGYIQDEPHRLSVARRAYEYQHEYGLGLEGRAVVGIRAADTRSKFLQAFHDLLRLTDQFYRDASDTNVTADAFPVLIALRDLHMILAEGAHNQFRDLPWTARSEMLVQQWLLSRQETREFLRGRVMVPYPEAWMGAVDAMKRLQGWTDTNIIHFGDLARFGERLLLSVRHVRWDMVADPEIARDWANAWRPEVQGYIHAYRMATGVSLSDDVVEPSRPDMPRYTRPSILLRARLEQQRAGQLPSRPEPTRLSVPARPRSLPAS